MPWTGKVEHWRPPVAEAVRVDSGIAAGLEITPNYDPMLAKVIAWGPDRESARRRLRESLKKTVLYGVTTNRRFLVDVLGKHSFVSGKATTAFIDKEFSADDLAQAIPGFEQAAAAAVVHYQVQCDVALARAVSIAAPLREWSSTGSLVSRYRYASGEATIDLTVYTDGGGTYCVRCQNHQIEVRVIACEAQLIRRELAGHVTEVSAVPIDERRIHLSMDGESWIFEQGSRLAILEAMKMEHEITAPTGGTVQHVACTKQQQVGIDDLLFEITLD